MASVSSVQATFGTQAVGLAFSRFWFQELLDATSRQAAVDSVRALLSTISTGYMSTAMTIQVEQKIQNFDLATGKLSNEVSAGTRPPGIAGAVTGSPPYVSGVGARILWSTGVVINGRKVVGRTFLVPLVAFTTSAGAVTGALISTMAPAISTYVASRLAQDVRPDRRDEAADLPRGQRGADQWRSGPVDTLVSALASLLMLRNS
jgi:hypothetical protein